jgi:hypothetical protein
MPGRPKKSPTKKRGPGRPKKSPTKKRSPGRPKKSERGANSSRQLAGDIPNLLALERGEERLTPRIQQMIIMEYGDRRLRELIRRRNEFASRRLGEENRIIRQDLLRRLPPGERREFEAEIEALRGRNRARSPSPGRVPAGLRRHWARSPSPARARARSPSPAQARRLSSASSYHSAASGVESGPLSDQEVQDCVICLEPGTPENPLESICVTCPSDGCQPERPVVHHECMRLWLRRVRRSPTTNLECRQV